MGINDESNIEANLQIGPTDQGMVRLFIEGTGIEIPMDFDPCKFLAKNLIDQDFLTKSLRVKPPRP